MGALSLSFVVIGGLMVPGGTLAGAPNPVAITTIVVGSLILVLAVGLGVGSLKVKDVPFLGGAVEIDTRDTEFRGWYRERRPDLVRFALLLSGNVRQAQDLVREAAARTRLNWGYGAREEALARTAGWILGWLEHPSLRGLAATRERRAWRREPGPEPVTAELQARIVAFGSLSLRDRAILLLHEVLDLDDAHVGALLGIPAADVRAELDAATGRLSAVLSAPAGPAPW